MIICELSGNIPVKVFKLQFQLRVLVVIYFFKALFFKINNLNQDLWLIQMMF